MRNFHHTFLKDNTGVTSIEYALITALIGMTLVMSANLVGNDLTKLFGGFSSQLASVGSGSEAPKAEPKALPKAEPQPQPQPKPRPCRCGCARSGF